MEGIQDRGLARLVLAHQARHVRLDNDALLIDEVSIELDRDRFELHKSHYPFGPHRLVAAQQA